MRFFLGLLVGAALGAGGVYVWLERPAWLAGEFAAAAPDAGVEAAPEDDRPRRKKRGRRGRRGRRAAQERAAQGAAAAQGEDVPALTEADRRLVWKGDAVALPPRELDFADQGTARPLDNREINQVIEAQSDGVVACIAEARGEAPLEARIELEMLVDGQGRVTRMRARAPSYLFERGFYPCVRRAALGLRFPATGAHTRVDAPYELR